MKKMMKAGFSFLKKLYASLIGCIFYDKKYLTGKYFHKYAFSQGWRWLLETVFMQKIVGINREIPFPVSFRMIVVGWENIEFDEDNINIFHKVGNYYNASNAKITIGKGSFIAYNVGIITANHNPENPSEHLPAKPVTLGKECWIGMNSVILPGVELGDHTIVGAGSIVTKSFPEGHCVIAGNPAKVIRKLQRDEYENIAE